MARSNGTSLNALIAAFDKTDSDYVRWCADNSKGPSQMSSVQAYLIAMNTDPNR